jgi:enoyl-CoA hydratase/carnithine racemase
MQGLPVCRPERPGGQAFHAGRTVMSDVLVARDGGVMTLTLARPQKKNALTGAMYEAMIAAFTDAEDDASIGAIVLRGSGGVFTAGNDIGDFIAAAQAPHLMAAYRFVEKLAQLEKPLVLAIEGPAVGIGTTILLHCDLAFASPNAQFKMPFVDLGLVPEAGSSLLLPQRIGMARAADLLLLGKSFTAQRALELGLINGIVPVLALENHAGREAVALAEKPRNAMLAARKLMRGDRAPLLAKIREEGAAFAAALQSGEAQKAFQSFMGKGGRA